MASFSKDCVEANGPASDGGDGASYGQACGERRPWQPLRVGEDRQTCLAGRAGCHRDGRKRCGPVERRAATSWYYPRYYWSRDALI